MSISVSRLRRTPPRSASGASKQTLAAAGVAAIAAAGLGIAALQGSSAPAPVETTATVVIAERAIPRGTLLTGLAAEGALRTRDVPADEVRADALSSTDAVKGKIASATLKPGSQLTAASVAADTGALSSRLTEGQRAVTVPIDAAHGMAGEVKESDRVDLYGSYQLQSGGTSRAVVKLIAQDIRVLRAPAATKKGSDAATALTQITLALGAQTATEVAYTADNGKLWVAARPANGGPRVKPKLVTIESLLFGVDPIVTKAAVEAAAAATPAPAVTAAPAAPVAPVVTAAGPAPALTADPSAATTPRRATPATTKTKREPAR